jgi:hypothetical protein
MTIIGGITKSTSFFRKVKLKIFKNNGIEYILENIRLDFKYFSFTNK